MSCLLKSLHKRSSRLLSCLSRQRVYVWGPCTPQHCPTAGYREIAAYSGRGVRPHNDNVLRQSSHTGSVWIRATHSFGLRQFAQIIVVDLPGRIESTFCRPCFFRYYRGLVFPFGTLNIPSNGRLSSPVCVCVVYGIVVVSGSHFWYDTAASLHRGLSTQSLVFPVY